MRPTMDVDAIAEIASYGEYMRFSERLRAPNLRYKEALIAAATKTPADQQPVPLARPNHE